MAGYVFHSLSLAAFVLGALALSALFVRQRRARLAERVHDELEQRVSERTSDLLDTNRRLTREIEERQRTETELRRARDELVQAAKLAAIGQLAAGINHELNQYYRLNVVTIPIPPLRERREDIALLFQHFVLVASARYERATPPPASEQLPALLAHEWPGNVRELRNAAERYVLLGENHDYDLERLLHNAGQSGALGLREEVENFEKSLIEQALKTCKGNVSEATLELGVPRKTLHDKLRKYELDRRHYG